MGAGGHYSGEVVYPVRVVMEAWLEPAGSVAAGAAGVWIGTKLAGFSWALLICMGAHRSKQRGARESREKSGLLVEIEPI